MRRVTKVSVRGRDDALISPATAVYSSPAVDCPAGAHHITPTPPLFAASSVSNFPTDVMS